MDCSVLYLLHLLNTSKMYQQTSVRYLLKQNHYGNFGHKKNKFASEKTSGFQLSKYRWIYCIMVLDHKVNKQ